MYLTKEEEGIYNGEFGWANQVSMKILVRLGELFDASRLIPVNSAHVSGVSYKTLGDAPAEFLKTLADAHAKTKTEATLNPQSMDREYLRKRLPSEVCRKQSDIRECFERMGFAESLTCTPYYLRRQRWGSHLAWAESSAVVYANSVLGAWTNREGGPSALAAAIVGKTPDCGMHRAENRQPKVLIKLETQLKSEAEFGVLGIFLGSILEDKVPMIQGLGKPSRDNLKQLAAGLASTGMVNMFHYEDTGESFGGVERINVEAKDIAKTMESLSPSTFGEPDLVYVGCPHCSLEEVRNVAELIGNKRIRSGTEFWLCTSRHMKEKAAAQVKRIERSGGHVIADTCAVVTWTDKLGIETIMTNSAKTAHYAPTLNRARTTLAPVEQCLATAFKG